jgi:hypothetical protein
MTFSIKEHSNSLTPEEYNKGLRDPYWFATVVLKGDSGHPYVPQYLCRKHPFYVWCVEKGIRLEVVHSGMATMIYGYIQHHTQAVEAKIRFG